MNTVLRLFDQARDLVHSNFRAIPSLQRRSWQEPTQKNSEDRALEKGPEVICERTVDEDVVRAARVNP
ncbi:hypothetical protein [Stenotrophomonas sp. 22385]|uniref:hypothetical protein n=1 Tax=Stenotrophomonas sp. 22385 TaxID=3453915 RepID=UPI003F8441F6